MRYMMYRRDESGLVTRTHQVTKLSGTERRELYPVLEALKGWPEPRVYWTRATGYAVGVAPLK